MFHMNQDDDQANALEPIEEPQHTMPLLSALSGTESGGGDEVLGFEGGDESKRLAVQSALLIAIVALIAGGVLFGMRFTQGGATANAATEELAKIQTFIRKAENPGLVSKDDPQHPDKLRLMAEGADALVKQIGTDYIEKAVPVEQVAKNPFELAIRKAADSGPSPDAAENQRRQRVEALEAEFARLDLQSIMGSGARSVAVIDGEFYRVGARLGSFKIAGIRPGKVGLLPAELEPRPDDPRFILEIQEQADASPRF